MVTVSEQPPPTPARSLWFAILSGPIIWSVHFLAVYLLVEVACRAGVLLDEWMGMRLISMVVIGASTAALLAVLFSGLFAYRIYRRPGNRADAGGSAGQEESLAQSPVRFMALSGMLLNGLFGLLIIMMGIPALRLQPCVM